MTEPKRRFDIEPKTGIPTLQQWGAYKRQAALYAQALSAEIRHQYPEPLPAGDYALRDVDYTMTWWKRFTGEPVLVNKLRGRAQQTIFSLNDLIHPGTIDAMTPTPPTVTSQPLYDDDCRAYGCGCVR
jgi:hypothetical protein